VADCYWNGAANPRQAILEYANQAFSTLWKNEITQAVMDLETTNRRERKWNASREWVPESPDLSGTKQFVIAAPQAVDRIFAVLQQLIARCSLYKKIHGAGGSCICVA